jgi:hypothetical protein
MVYVVGWSDPQRIERRNAMQQFIAKFDKDIQGTLSGFDRLVFRGTLPRLSYAEGMKLYLIQNKLLFKDYESHVKAVSQKVKKAALEPFQQQNLPVKYVYGRDDKEQIARALAAAQGITEGDVCALTTMEMAPTFQHEKTSMVMRPRPGLTIYHYRLDPEFGWMHARIQTWFPFCIHVCINGREWLSRRMDREGLRYFRQDNCFPWIEDIPRTQQLFQEQLTVCWTQKLQWFAQRLNPLHEEIFQNYPSTYYWTAFQCEWATDVMFRPGTLARLSPLFLQHAMLGLSSPDVMKFLGHRVNVSGQIPANFRGELTMDFKRRVTGDRVKYRMDGNSLKGYGKASTPVGDLFRVETTTQNVEGFKVYRPTEGASEDALRWQRMRRGVADLFRRAEVSQKINERFYEALATVDDSTRFSEFTRTLEQPCLFKGRRVRALHLFREEDHRLLEAVNHGEFMLRGLRNRDLQALIYPPAPADAPLSLPDRRRRSAAISRKLRLLRAHGLIQKIPKTHRYQLTPHGRLAITAILTMDRTSIAVINQLQKAA